MGETSATQTTNCAPKRWTADLHHETRHGGRFYAYVRAAGELVPVATVCTGVEGYGRDEGRANVHLIAAAPDLLDAVKGLLDLIDKLKMDPLALQIARAAVLKAEEGLQ